MKCKQTYWLGFHGNKLLIQQMFISTVIPLVNKLDLLIYKSKHKANWGENKWNNLSVINLCKLNIYS